MSAADYAAIDTSNWSPGTRYFTQITEVNHAGWLYIVTLISFVYVIIAVIIRFIVKFGAYGYDDWALLASTLLAVCQYVTVIAGISKGIGKSGRLLSLSRMLELRKYAAAHIYLHVLAHCGSKLSTAVLVQRLFDNGRKRNTIMSWGLVFVSAMYGVGTIMALGIACSNPYDSTGGGCPHLYIRWQVMMALDISTEALLVIVPVLLIADIHIKPSAKLTVLAVFAFRLVDIFFAASNLYLVHHLPDEPDQPLAIVKNLLWTQAELLWSIVAASLPCLKTFMRPFDKIDDSVWRSSNRMYSSNRTSRNWGAGEGKDRHGIVPLEDIKGHNRGLVRWSSGTDKSLELRPDASAVSHNVVITHGADNSLENVHTRGSWGSQERIIKQQTHFEIKTEYSIRGGKGKDPV